jgi:hypothetical protein
MFTATISILAFLLVGSIFLFIFFRKIAAVSGVSLKILVSEFITSVRENGLRNELKLWKMAGVDYRHMKKILAGIKGEGPSILEFVSGVKKNGLESELKFLESLEGKDSYARIVELAFHYQRRTLIYN